VFYALRSLPASKEVMLLIEPGTSLPAGGRKSGIRKQETGNRKQDRINYYELWFLEFDNWDLFWEILFLFKLLSCCAIVYLVSGSTKVQVPCYIVFLVCFSGIRKISIHLLGNRFDRHSRWNHAMRSRCSGGSC